MYNNPIVFNNSFLRTLRITHTSTINLVLITSRGVVRAPVIIPAEKDYGQFLHRAIFN